ncbi:alpha/beta fold hydrolase [Rhodospirillaceae bacterium KN72]|uniref:Alpha/beta fold hydrolase n=1 Tax=Pacificispira spongiicola TaxID=2729598 RepID=A0A7Y0DY34_9PROT|nr:alpha/beta family hydrolase [Pacificispira spongiicola]NMM43744.1 alpha/beta fold hydrolase [Pacificispira spongiicola]
MQAEFDLPFIDTGPDDAAHRLVLAHGAGAPMDSPFMETMAALLAGKGVAVTRFEFPYMAERRREGRKKPPDRAPVLIQAWRQALADCRQRFPRCRLSIGGKSMGGRMATMLAAEQDRPDDLVSVVTLGYPFHPPGKPEKTRTDHFAAIDRPVLMLQGMRDPFGTESEVSKYPLPANSTLFWLPDGDHDFKPRKASGSTHEGNLSIAADKVAGFLDSY